MLRIVTSMLRENENVLNESETHLFFKRFWSHMTEIKKSKKKLSEAIKNFGEKSPFWKDTLHSKNIPPGRGNYYHVGKPCNRDQHNKCGRFQRPFQNNNGKKFQYLAT